MSRKSVNMVIVASIVMLTGSLSYGKIRYVGRAEAKTISGSSCGHCNIVQSAMPENGCQSCTYGYVGVCLTPDTVYLESSECGSGVPFDCSDAIPYTNNGAYWWQCSRTNMSCPDSTLYYKCSGIKHDLEVTAKKCRK